MAAAAAACSVYVKTIRNFFCFLNGTFTEKKEKFQSFFAPSSSLFFLHHYSSCWSLKLPNLLWGVKFYIVVAPPLSTTIRLSSQYSLFSHNNLLSLSLSPFPILSSTEHVVMWRSKKLWKMMSDYGTLVWSSAKFLFLFSFWRFLWCWWLVLEMTGSFSSVELGEAESENYWISMWFFNYLVCC